MQPATFVSKHGCMPARIIIFHSILSRLTLQSTSAWATLGGRGGLLKTIHHIDPLQDPLFWSKGQEKARVLQQEPVLRETHRKSMERVL